MNPKGFGKYAESRRKSGDNIDVFAARFASRFNFASQIESIKFDNFGEETADAYLLLLRISLGYSAFESLFTFLSTSDISVKNAQLAKALKTKPLSKLRQFVLDESDKKLNNQLLAFFGNAENCDLLPFIRALRHAMFHGQLSPSAAGLRSKTARTFLRKLDVFWFDFLNERGEQVFLTLMQPSRAPSNRRANGSGRKD
jgi:hypothetical protein